MKTWNILDCVWIGIIFGAVLGNDFQRQQNVPVLPVPAVPRLSIEHAWAEIIPGELVLTSSPATATDGERFTLICSVSSGFVVNMAWLQENTTKVITQLFNGCTKQKPVVGNNISRFSVSCINTVHSIQFKFSSTRDQGGWQCGNITTDTYIHPRSSIHSIAVAIPVMSTQSLPTTTRYRETTSEPGTVTPQKDDADSDTLYIVVGAVGGAVLLAVVVVGITFMRRRRQAAHQKEGIKGKRIIEATPVYQSRTSCHTVENEMYGKARGITPINEADTQTDDFVMSDAYATVDMPAASTCTPRQQDASCDVDLDSLYSKPDKSRSSNVQQVSDIYAEVKKPKKRRQDDPKMSEDVHTGDVYAKPIKG